MISKDDNALVSEVLQGNREAFGMLVEKYQGKIYRMAYRITGDSEMSRDITQDIFIKAYTGLHTFDPRYRFFSWLYRIALNESINRKRYRKHTVGLDSVHELSSGNTEADTEKESHRILRQTLRDLKEEYRSLVILKYYFGLSYDDIAETLDIPLKKVRSRMFTAREALREKLVKSKYFGHD